MRAKDIAVGSEYAYVVRGQAGEGPQAVPVLVLAAPVAGRVRVRIVAGPVDRPIRGFPAAGTDTEIATRSLLSSWAQWEADTQPSDHAIGTLVAIENLPELTPEDAVAMRLDEDKLLVLGNTDRAAALGTPLYTLTPELTRATAAELGTAFGAAASAALHVASAVEGVRQAGLVFQVSKTSVAQFRRLEAVMSNGEMLGVLRGDARIQTLVRWNTAGTGLRSLASVSGIIFTACHIAGQAHMLKNLTALLGAVDDLKEMGRDEQLALVRVARCRMVKVVELAAELGELTPELAAELPDRHQLEVQLACAAEEVDRHNRRLRSLPSKAGDKLQVLQRTLPDVVRALSIYAETESALMLAEVLHRHVVAQSDEVTAAALERYELRQREDRVAAGIRLADGVNKALKAVEAEPGGGWFAGGKRKQVRMLSGQVRADLAALQVRPLPSSRARAAVGTGPRRT